MNMQTRQAYALLTDARKQVVATRVAIVDISNRAGIGDCACSNGGACAYHADLLIRLDDIQRRAEGVLAELRADIALPVRKH